jgi:hypothetical protein
VVTIVELVLLALASYRATRLVVHDVIADPARDIIFRWREHRLDSPIREAAVTLISCTYCAGFWVTGILLAVYLTATGQWGAAPLLVHGIEWLAVAGAAALLNRADDTLAEAAA